jgi:hypothetical protein
MVSLCPQVIMHRVSTPKQKSASGPEEEQASLRRGIELYAPGSTPAEMAGVPQPGGGCGVQEAGVISPVPAQKPIRSGNRLADEDRD